MHRKNPARALGIAAALLVFPYRTVGVFWLAAKGFPTNTASIAETRSQCPDNWSRENFTARPTAIPRARNKSWRSGRRAFMKRSRKDDDSLDCA